MNALGLCFVSCPFDAFAVRSVLFFSQWPLVNISQVPSPLWLFG